MSDPKPENLDHGVDEDPDFPAAEGEPSIDGVLGQLSRMIGGLGGSADGWSSIDDAGSALQKQRADSTRAMKAQSNVFRDTFMTPAGRECLELMLNQTLRASPYPMEANLPRDVIETLVITHDAQCNFVRAILTAIAHAQNSEAKRS